MSGAAMYELVSHEEFRAQKIFHENFSEFVEVY